ncbi:uncharacterized protein K441DRAFT_575766 [Cenococcum geophilum 1.58]|uniref:uncharacterized protein n=1 Tax=Cenococcum geophilum 1.58 TaxID=794803 RepID=UPI00358DDDF5|nr:hypothetical protein K441DRAFT_575766 [Cenococcum geophilum 1.58]
MAQATNTLSQSPNLTTSPPRSQLKTPAHTLVRVRNNQRRHRERRREYIASLEQKLQETERLLAQATTELAASNRPSAWMLPQPQDPLDHTPSCYPPSYCELVEDSSVPLISEDNARPESDPELRKILSPPIPSFCNIYPPSDTESTTLCSQAFVLISQQNFREIDAYTIKSWLYEGFRQARNENEGCRVDNKLLFGLLDFISSS